MVGVDEDVCVALCRQQQKCGCFVYLRRVCATEVDVSFSIMTTLTCKSLLLDRSRLDF